MGPCRANRAGPSTTKHGIRIHFDVYAPEAVGAIPAAVVQLAHGVGEHAGRYRALCEHLAAAGFLVYADDHRGHGRTGMEQWKGDAGRLGRLGPGGLRAAVAACTPSASSIRDENPDLPLAFLGHSWGSLMAQLLLNRYSDEYDGLVLSGTAYRMLGSMNSGDLNKRYAHLGTTGAEWLSRDPAVAQAFVDDPLTTSRPLQKLFGHARRRCASSAGPRATSRTTCRADPGRRRTTRSAARERAAPRARRTARGRGYGRDDDRLPGARHEVFNETNRAEVIGRPDRLARRRASRPQA